MTDEIQQPVPESQPQLALPAPLAGKLNKQAKGSIEKLPEDIQKDIQEYYKKTNGVETQKYISEKYGEQYPHVKNLSKNTIYTYAKKHSLKTLREVVLATEVTKLSREYDKFVGTTFDPNSDLADKRAALLDLINFYKRVAVKLEATQTNFTDPLVWRVILQVKSQLLDTIDALTKYDKEVLLVKQKDINEEADNIVNLCTTALESAYRMTHKDQSNFADFLATYNAGIKDCFNNYRHVQDAFKEPQVKKN